MYASVDVFRVTTEIYAPSWGVGIVGQYAFHCIYQSRVFSQGYVKAWIHAWPSNEVVEEIQCYAFWIFWSVASFAYHHVSLVCASLLCVYALCVCMCAVVNAIFWWWGQCLFSLFACACLYALLLFDVIYLFVFRFFLFFYVFLHYLGAIELSYCLLRLFEVDIAKDEKYHLIWTVETVAETKRVICCKVPHIVGIAKDVVSEIAVSKNDILEMVVY